MTSEARFIARRTAAVTIALIGLPWVASALGTALTGVSDADLHRTPAVVEEGEAAATAGTSSAPLPVSTPAREITRKAARSRPTTPTTRTGTGQLNWTALAQCESGGNPRAVSASGKYRGLYQFDLATWRSVGGSGDPAQASPSEQTHRAYLLYKQRGRSPWPTCGRRL